MYVKLRLDTWQQKEDIQPVPFIKNLAKIKKILVSRTILRAYFWAEYKWYICLGPKINIQDNNMIMLRLRKKIWGLLIRVI